MSYFFREAFFVLENTVTICYNLKVFKNLARVGETMNRLTDKAVILLLCVIASVTGESFATPVISILIVVACSSLIQYATGRKTAGIIILTESLICVFVPEFFCVSPLILYDALWEKKPAYALPCLAVAVNISHLTALQVLIISAGLIVAGVLFMRTANLEKTHKQLISLRDISVERTYSLERRNRQLIQEQDNEIYLATLSERNRIAREIHDNVGHMLTRSILQVGAFQIINKDEDLKEPLESLKETLNTAMTSIRQSVHNLHDDSIDLKSAVAECVRSAKQKFDVRFDYDITGNVDKNIKLCLIGVTKESISNCIKHSDGDKINVILREHPAFYQLAVEDNGRCKKIESQGIGLINMKDRADKAGGIINFTPSEKGFKVFLSVPKNGRFG